MKRDFVRYLAAATAAASIAAGCGGNSGTSSTGGSGNGPTTPPHIAHLRGSDLAIGLACNDCHSVSGFAVDFSQGTMPVLPGKAPAFDPATKTCSNVHCHGHFEMNGIPGAMASPRWNDPGPLSCEACHGMAPPSHMQVFLAPDPGSCASCHSDTVHPNGRINFAGRGHLNGKADVNGGGCASCHGDARRTGNLPGADPIVASAPPGATSSAGPNAVGAHVAHVNPPASGSIAGPTACSECHVVPTDATHATSPPAVKVVFGPLARTQGNNPVWDPATAGCSATYCHGSFSFSGVAGTASTPSWTSAAPVGCTSCHGMPPAGHVAVNGAPAASSCAVCHPRTVNGDGSINVAAGGHVNGAADTAGPGCTDCHGDPARTANLAGTDLNLVSAPPVASPNGTAISVGAHLGHVNPTAASAIADPVACSACHTIPGDSTHAIRPPPSRVTFGGTAIARGAAPTWNAATAGCSATYCHGNFNLNGVTGSNATVTWTDTAPLGCTSCHGMPPAGHIAVNGAPAAASCAPCHSAAVNANGSINLVDGGHLNGLPDVSAEGCTACHGDAARLPSMAGTDPNLLSAPPAATASGGANAVGAHLPHVNPTTASARMKPISCATCHPVPGDSTHATTPPPNPVAFTGIAVAATAVPAWLPGNATCSATYCHGNFNYNGVSGKATTEAWTGAGPLGCTACHDMPPANHVPVTGGPNAAPSTCNQCHSQTVSATGVLDLTYHLDGRPQGGDCGSCHALPPSTGAHREADHLRLRCDGCHPAGYTSSQTVASFHNNNVKDIASSAGYSCGLTGCPTGTVGTCTNSCHGRESWR